MSEYPNQEVSTLRKSGQTDAAYRRGQELIRQHPNDKYLRNSVGWVLYDMLKQLYIDSSTDQADTTVSHSSVRQLLHEYAHLKLDRPDLLFSCILSLLLRFKSMPEFFPKFLYWAGLQSFQKDDFRAGSSDEQNKIFPSLVESIAVSVAKQVVSNWTHYDRHIHEFVLELTDFALSDGEVSDPLWLRYRKGQLLCKMGRYDEAREHLKYTIERKSGEYWTWHALASCERVSSPSKALTLCIKAYMVATDKKFTVSVLEDIIRLACDTKDFDLARWAVDMDFSIRKNVEWRLPEFISTCLTSEWYASAPVLEDPDQILAKHAVSAESLFFEGKWQMASLIEVFTSSREKRLIKLIRKTDTETSVEVVPARLYPDIAKLKSGAPLFAAIKSSEERTHILALKIREEGEEFDCLLQLHGILDHHNEKKKQAFVYLSPSSFCPLYYSEYTEVCEWEPGISVIMSCTYEKNKGYRAYKASRISAWDSEWVCRKTGKLHIHQKGFGFVDDMFVAPHLIGKDWKEGQVSVVAVMKPKRGKESELSWQVVSIKPVKSK